MTIQRFVLSCAVLTAILTAPIVGAAEKPRPKPNHLAGQTSPYLLMHLHNPVDWHPWGEEALAKAKKENKLIFLSIGYSSCYWCHVMERESFLDEEIAKLLNANFVCIKVDREERPDVDEIFMTALAVMDRPGGWPLTMFLSPDAKPIIGGTYFPPRDKGGRPGFVTVLNSVQKFWMDNPDDMKKQATAVADAVKRSLQAETRAALAKLDQQFITDVQIELAKEYDSKTGGFGATGPKFPSTSNLVFLLDRHRRGGDDVSRSMATRILDRMSQGGLRDHLGGGFHRYTVDPNWAIPHFEKMLYDNAQLASVYGEGYALTKRADYRRVAEEALDFVLREMTDKDGGFYSAIDAETDAVEGKFYVWSRDELEKLLTKDEFALVAEVYGVNAGPNFEEKLNVLQLAKPLAELAKDRGLTEDKLEAALKPVRAKLLDARNKRKRPLTDTKILTSWNGLMIRALADAGRIFETQRYTKAAARAADFLLAKSRKEGRLYRTHTAGEAKLNGYLDDYANLIDGLIALHRATGDKKWLAAAKELTDVQVKLFWDEKGGGFYFTSHDHEALLARRKDAADNVLPAGNSVAAGNLLYLAAALESKDYYQKAELTLKTITPRLLVNPSSVPRAAVSLAAYFDAKKPESK